MKNTIFATLGFMLLTILSSCSKNEQNPIPEPQKKDAKNCRLIKRIVKQANNESSYEYIYDANNRIVEERVSYNGNPGGSYFYLYNALGQLIEENSIGFTYQYNSAGLLLFKRHSANKDETRYYYNSNGLLDSTISGKFNANNTTFAKYSLGIFNYNPDKSLKRATYFSLDSTGTFSKTPSVVYENESFDNFKNPTALGSYSLKQLKPEHLFLKNNILVQNVTTPNNAYSYNYTYTYRPDSLLATSTYSNSQDQITTQYFYDCN